jgi:hypothetical protein
MRYTNFSTAYAVVCLLGMLALVTPGARGNNAPHAAAAASDAYARVPAPATPVADGPAASVPVIALKPEPTMTVIVQFSGSVVSLNETRIAPKLPDAVLVYAAEYLDLYVYAVSGTGRTVAEYCAEIAPQFKTTVCTGDSVIGLDSTFAFNDSPAYFQGVTGGPTSGADDPLLPTQWVRKNQAQSFAFLRLTAGSLGSE